MQRLEASGAVRPIYGSLGFKRLNKNNWDEMVGLFRFKWPMKIEQSDPKRRHIKFRRRGITQKKAYNIHDKAKVWNQEHVCCLESCLLIGFISKIKGFYITVLYRVFFVEKNRQTSSVYDCTVGDVEYVAAILLLS